MTKVLYFAYGSNMLLHRLQRRCPSARLHAKGFAQDYAVTFAKVGRDGSGKATLTPATGANAHGVIFELDELDLIELDRIEGRGRGYERIDEFSINHDGESEFSRLSVATCISGPPHLDETLQPFSWYLDLVVEGARQNSLPAAHVERLAGTTCFDDPEPDRPQRLEALQVLELARRGKA